MLHEKILCLYLLYNLFTENIFVIVFDLFFVFLNNDVFNIICDKNFNLLFIMYCILIIGDF